MRRTFGPARELAVHLGQFWLLLVAHSPAMGASIESKLAPNCPRHPSPRHGLSRFKIVIAALQQANVVVPLAGKGWLFAYNGLPAIAVAKDCWFGARQFSTCPFFMPGRINSIL